MPKKQAKKIYKCVKKKLEDRDVFIVKWKGFDTKDVRDLKSDLNHYLGMYQEELDKEAKGTVGSEPTEKKV